LIKLVRPTIFLMIQCGYRTLLTRRRFGETKGLSAQVEMDFSDEGLSVCNPKGLKPTPWNNFPGWG
jgi:hypothetical protein